MKNLWEVSSLFLFWHFLTNAQQINMEYPKSHKECKCQELCPSIQKDSPCNEGQEECKPELLCPKNLETNLVYVFSMIMYSIVKENKLSP